MTTIAKQVKVYSPRMDATLVHDYGAGALLTANVRHDDSCKNGYNSFAITGDVTTFANKRRNDIEAGGCLHEDIARLFPELKPFIKWHLTGTDGPMHYIADTMYWLGWRGYCDGKTSSPPNLQYARDTAVWPDMPESYVAPLYIREEDTIHPVFDLKPAIIEKALRDRLPGLLEQFRTDVESLGLVY